MTLLALRGLLNRDHPASFERFDIKSGETAEAALQRLFLEKTDKAVSARRVLAPYTEGTVLAGVKRYTFSPDAAYAKELTALPTPMRFPNRPAVTGAKCLTVSSISRCCRVRGGKCCSFASARMSHCLMSRRCELGSLVLAHCPVSPLP